MLLPTQMCILTASTSSTTCTTVIIGTWRRALLVHHRLLLVWLAISLLSIGLLTIWLLPVLRLSVRSRLAILPRWWAAIVSIGRASRVTSWAGVVVGLLRLCRVAWRRAAGCFLQSEVSTGIGMRRMRRNTYVFRHGCPSSLMLGRIFGSSASVFSPTLQCATVRPPL